MQITEEADRIVGKALLRTFVTICAVQSLIFFSHILEALHR